MPDPSMDPIDTLQKTAYAPESAASPLAAGTRSDLQMTLRRLLRRLVLPIISAVVFAGAIELAIELRYHPGFWQRTTWLMHDPYRGEIFDRVMLYQRLGHFEDSDPDIISVGDSSGFFAIQSTIVNRYTHGVRYLSLNTGANYAYQGYRAVAEYMLRRSKHIKYVVVYVFPQLVPVPYIIELADLAPIVRDSLVGPKSYLTPPSAFLSPYVKYELFVGYRYHFGDVMLRQAPSLQLGATLDQALGWLPEFDVRVGRINGQLPFFTDKRATLAAQLGLAERSSIYAVLDDFNNMVESYGAHLAIAFAPISERGMFSGDPMIAEADEAYARFSHDHPDVKMLFPLITRWSPEKFGTANHVSREYTFLSSERLGKALGRLVDDPDSIPPYRANFKPSGPLPTIDVKPTGPADADLLKSALAYYLYNSTLDAAYRQLISQRVLDLLENDQAYKYMMEDAQKRVASLKARQIDIGFDLSGLRARPVELSGMSYCNARPDTQWVQIDGNMGFTYHSPSTAASEPVRWPETSHILIPTILEDGIRKFDGYCPEPDAALADSATIDRMN